MGLSKFYAEIFSVKRYCLMLFTRVCFSSIKLFEVFPFGCFQKYFTTFIKLKPTHGQSTPETNH
jgi:hypothetical protein